MDLFILRHGKTSNDYSVYDMKNRPITFTSRHEISNISIVLKKYKIKLDLIFTSPLNACYQTAEIVNGYMKEKIKIIRCQELQPENSFFDFYKKIIQISEKKKNILIIGHEPYLTDMISDIISISELSNKSSKKSTTKKININLKKAGLSKIKILSTFPTPKGELRWLLTPRLLRKLSMHSNTTTSNNLK